MRLERDISTNTFSAQIKAKEITGEDIEIDVGEIDTDVIVDVNINELARTEGIVSTETRENYLTKKYHFITRTPTCWRHSPPRSWRC